MEAFVSDDFKVLGSSFQILDADTEKALAQVEFSFRNKICCCSLGGITQLACDYLNTYLVYTVWLEVAVAHIENHPDCAWGRTF